jgi:HEAT repeat protein
MISCTLLCLSGLLVSQPAPGDLERKFREGDEAARLELLQSLATDDPTVAKQAMPVLVKALGDVSSAVRAEAALRINGTKELGSDAIPALCRCLEDRDLRVRRRAVMAISNIARQPEVAVPALRKVLRDPDFEKDTEGVDRS